MRQTFEHLQGTDIYFHLFNLHFLSSYFMPNIKPTDLGWWRRLGCCCPVSDWATPGSGLVQTGSTCKMHARHSATRGQCSRCERQRHTDVHNEEVTWQRVWASCHGRLSQSGVTVTLWFGLRAPSHFLAGPGMVHLVTWCTYCPLLKK